MISSFFLGIFGSNVKVGAQGSCFFEGLQSLISSVRNGRSGPLLNQWINASRATFSRKV